MRSGPSDAGGGTPNPNAAAACARLALRGRHRADPRDEDLVERRQAIAGAMRFLDLPPAARSGRLPWLIIVT